MLGKNYSLGATDEYTGESRVKLANFDELRSQGDAIASFLNDFNPDPQYTYLHVIAMSAGDYYGPNINGDYFPERDLIARHKTFETNAKVFKEHDNKPYSQDYGHVAFSWYNQKMHRVELILAVDNIKGREFIDRQNRGEQLEVSMGCKVAYDVCSICGNKAKRREDYCEHIRYHKKYIYPDGKQAYMINYNPTFFDISIVRHRADKIAYVLAKVASEENSISNALADEFENLDKTCTIPEAPDPENAIFDIEEDEQVEKAASAPTYSYANPDSLPFAEKLAMIKQLNSNAVRVMNTGLDKAMPLLESVEPDLPAPLLDSLARRFDFADILKSALLNAVPLKPKEVTRIIVIQRNIPPKYSAEVLRGVLDAEPTVLPRATYRRDIGELLSPHLDSRSSYLPAVIERLKKALSLEKTSASHINLDTFGNYTSLNPALSFGFANHQPEYTQLNTTVPDRAYVIKKDRSYTTPAVLTPAMMYERERRRPNLDNPTFNPYQTGLLLGGIYAASRYLPAMGNWMSAHPEASIAAALASLYYAKKKLDAPQELQKTSSDSFIRSAAPYIMPFVGAHMASAHYRNAYNHGADLNGAEMFIANNPDVISLVAPVAVGYATHKLTKMKTASTNLSLDAESKYNNSMVEFADILADLAMQGN